MKFYLIKDILKCAKFALYITFGIFAFFGIIHYLFYSKNIINLFNTIKNTFYYIGCFGLLISSGFFIQKNAVRPLDNNDAWIKMFHKLNLGLVMMFISLFICLLGMIIQILLETKLY